MGGFVYQVHADWDPEAGVWVATSDDVPGLATEAPTVEALAEKLRIIIPELLEANPLLSNGRSGRNRQALLIVPEWACGGGEVGRLSP